MIDFFNISLSDLEATCRELGRPEVHAQTLFHAVYVKSFESGSFENLFDVSSLPLTLREYGEEMWSFSQTRVESFSVSKYDHSVKFVIRLHDDSLVEAVLMPESSRYTLCLSSQVGCKQACVFCSTGRMGLKRNLTAGEIVSQVVLVKSWIQRHEEWEKVVNPSGSITLSNLVYMGMGEPLDNVEAINKSIEILSSPYGFAFSKRKISVSTAGHLEGWNRLLAAHPTVSLAVSLHAPNERLRSQLLPINRRFPLADLMRAVESVSHSKKQGILIQYTMIEDVNDSEEQAEELAELLKNSKVKVNLIPCNDVPHSRWKGSSSHRMQKFRDVLHQKGVRSMIRYSKGQDIAAACGQLIKKPIETPVNL